MGWFDYLGKPGNSRNRYDGISKYEIRQARTTIAHQCNRCDE